jgi:hypothetical protein
MVTPVFCITREKHLDHMVRVVPFIVSLYAIQCYFIINMENSGIASDALLFLGLCLITMISSFITYDLTHIVNFSEDKIEITVRWAKYKKTLSICDISKVDVIDPGQSFSTIVLTSKDGKKHTFFFIDNADKIKKWIEDKQSSEFKIAA